MPHLHSTSRRPDPLKDTDYDHEINLIDHTNPQVPSCSPAPSASERPPSAGASDSSSQIRSDVPLPKHATTQPPQRKLNSRDILIYQNQQLESGSDNGHAEEDVLGEGSNHEATPGERGERGRTAGNGTSQRRKNPREPESTIDILYENQRGGFLCGMPLFSAKALGSLDPSPWSNIALKSSATDITNAQVPDPSWEWVWKDWSINHSDEVDEDGWEYSFSFSKKFSWHGPKWYSSFVRRRAWIRKRAKKPMGYQGNEAHIFHGDYFTIHSAQVRSRSRGSSLEGNIRNKHSSASLSRRDMEEDFANEDIIDIGSLMKALRLARIDREKTEAIESFIQHGGEDLYYLSDHMYEIMRTFIFQASRRLLLSHLLKISNAASQEQDSKCEMDNDPAKKRRIENLQAAVKQADEEVKRLEFWSDAKDIAETERTLGTTDDNLPKV
jgi:hypothetical protein